VDRIAGRRTQFCRHPTIGAQNGPLSRNSYVVRVQSSTSSDGRAGGTGSFLKPIVLTVLLAFLAAASNAAHADCPISQEQAPRLSVDAFEALRSFFEIQCTDEKSRLVLGQDPALKGHYEAPKGSSSTHKGDYYPVNARRKGHEGTTIVAYIIETDGHIKVTSVIRSSGFKDLDEASVDACRSIQYSQSARLDGAPVRSLIWFPIAWRLKP
jgi:TonB family protein